MKYNLNQFVCDICGGHYSTYECTNIQYFDFKAGEKVQKCLCRPCTGNFDEYVGKFFEKKEKKE